jgi:sterol carrier protein 2
MIHEPLTKPQCCPTSDGAAAAVVVSRSFLDKKPHQSSRAIEIIGQRLVSDSPALFSRSAMGLVGYEMVKFAASMAYEEAGVVPSQVKVAEIHDCFSTNQVLVIDATGICEQGKAHEYVRAGHSTFGTTHTLINPSGGLLSKGHPLGATGLAQCAELVWQLRVWANNRLVAVKSGQVALQQNAGLGGACVVTILRRADGKENHLRLTSEVASISGVGYNPATEARGTTEEQDKVVRSKTWSAWASAQSSSRGDGL